ncbi:MAG: SusC/RagA family TonB-linked outer membrane protein [Alistipes sp.]
MKPNLLLNTKCKTLAVAAAMLAFIAAPALATENESVAQPNMGGGFSAAQVGNNVVVKGVVKDSAGQPLVGVSVYIDGTSNGTITEADGSYSITAPADGTIVFSYIGYTDQKQSIDNRTAIDITMVEEAQAINDVVVVGYGTLKKTQLVGAVETLDGDAIESRSNANVTRSLQGMIPGLNIIQVDGKPTHQGQIYIRGGQTSYDTRSKASSATGAHRSIGQGGSALVLIDGVEGDLTTVNPDDIESVSVLKDAASAAVYGARGAFGVILVTTKNARKDKISVTYNGAVSIHSRTVKAEDEVVTDGLTWLDNFVEFFTNDTRTPTSSGKAPSNINNRANTYSTDYHNEFRKRATEKEYENYKNPYGTFPGKDNYAYYGSTNWYKLFYKNTSFGHTHNLSISGANDRASFVISGKYFNQDGIYKVGNEKFDSYNLRAKGDVAITKWLKIANNTTLFKNKYHQPMVVGGTYPIGRQIEMRGQPVYTPYNEDGTSTFYGAALCYDLFKNDLAYQEDNKLNIVNTTTLTIEPIKDVLKFTADFSYKGIRTQRNRVSPIASGYTSPTGVESYNSTSYKEDYRYNTDYVASNIVGTWTPKLGENHNLNVVLGWNIEKTNYRRLYIKRLGLLYDNMPNFEWMSSDEYTIQDDGYDKKMVGVFGRINYTLLNRYIFEFACRYDGSSLFPTNKQWGFFPSGSIGWRLSEEPWMQWSKSWLDNFKIRANVGSLGNASIDPYSFLELMSASKSGMLINGQKFYYTNAASMIPNNLTWETVTTYDLGVDFDLFRSRLSGSFDYYWRFTNDLLVTGPDYPQILGDESPKGNYGSLKTRGWEATLAWRDSFKAGGKDFNYSVRVSVWDSRTWVKDFYNANGDIYNYYKGKELGEIWGFRTKGYFLDNEEAAAWVQDTFHKNGSNFKAFAGDLRFLDLNDDQKIGYGKATLDDYGDLERIGNATPRYNYGINLAASWNGIGLSVFIQGVGKRDWYPSTDSGLFWGMYNRPYGELPKLHVSDGVRMDYSTENWKVTNPGAYFTRQVGYSANRNVGPLTYENDYYLQDASYVRIKNITIDYTFPQKLTRKAHIERLRIYLSMENLFTHSPMFKHTKLFDPEVIDYGDTDFRGDNYATGLSGNGQGYSYPMLKTFTFGLNITF